MRFASIRWRLPASYASVALLAALALGSLMLLVLSGYYTGQERDYLLGNATAARAAVEQALQSHLPAQALQDQVTGLAFLSQAQIRVLDADGHPLADSGVPDANQVVSLSGAPRGVTIMSTRAGIPLNGFSVALPAGTASPVTTVANGSTVASGSIVVGPAGTTLQVSASPFGFGFAGPQPSGAARSAQVVRLPLVSQPGSLEVSHGPAYGTEILRSVALAWLAASLAAVALGGLAGVIASRQVTQPVLALTEAARRMQLGDLASRAVLAPGPTAQEFSTLAETFNQMAQRVDDTISTLRAFVSDAAHELNTPLTALHTNLELALNEADDRQRALFLGRAVEQSARLERLASGLLDLSRLEAAGATPAPGERLDLTRLAADTGERFASRAEQAERNFTLALPAAPVRVRGQAGQLQRLLDNLLENALKFTPAGGAIRLSLTEQAGQAVLEVTDTGMGIPEDDRPHLFERFHRGRNAAPYPGTGLGLAIAQAIVDLHGGQVEAHSAGRDQGSQFVVRLALDQTEGGP